MTLEARQYILPVVVESAMAVTGSMFTAGSVSMAAGCTLEAGRVGSLMHCSVYSTNLDSWGEHS